MRVQVTGKQLDTGDALRGPVVNGLAAIIEKDSDRFIEANVTIATDGSMYRATPEKTDKRRNPEKARLGNQAWPGFADVAAEDNILAAQEERGTDPAAPQAAIVASIGTAIPTAMAHEAAMRMDLGNVPVLMFTNRATRIRTVVCRRRSGAVGRIEPGMTAVADGTVS